MGGKNSKHPIDYMNHHCNNFHNKHEISSNFRNTHNTTKSGYENDRKNCCDPDVEKDRADGLGGTCGRHGPHGKPHPCDNKYYKFYCPRTCMLHKMKKNPHTILSTDTKYSTSCGYIATCANGDAPIAMVVPIPTNECASCFNGYKLEGKNCLRLYPSICTNGTPDTTKQFTINNKQYCAKCNPGYVYRDKKCMDLKYQENNFWPTNKGNDSYHYLEYLIKTYNYNNNKLNGILNYNDKYWIRTDNIPNFNNLDLPSKNTIWQVSLNTYNCNKVLNYSEDILTCPNGTIQNGEINADIPGCGLTDCNQRFSQNNIEECRIACDEKKDCKAFNFAPVKGDKSRLDKPVCTLYNSSEPTSTWGPNTIFCKMDDTQNFYRKKYTILQGTCMELPCFYYKHKFIDHLINKMNKNTHTSKDTHIYYFIRNRKFPTRQLTAHKDIEFDHKNRNGNVTKDDYIFVYRENPSDVYTLGNRKTDILKYWKFIKSGNNIKLVAYNETEKASLLTKIANGDSLWTNMGTNYTNIKCIYMETIKFVAYYVILLVSNNNIRILAVRDIYDPPNSAVSSYIISKNGKEDITKEKISNYLRDKNEGKDTKNDFYWSFETKFETITNLLIEMNKSTYKNNDTSMSYFIRNRKFPTRQLTAHKDIEFDHKNRNGNVTKDDYIFVYRENPSDVYTRGNRKTDILKYWKFIKNGNNIELVAYKGKEKVSLLTKIANGDSLWTNMGTNYTNIKCIYMKKIGLIDYYAILLVSNNNIRILAVRDIYAPPNSAVSSYIISKNGKEDITKEKISNYLRDKNEGKDTKNDFYWSFEITDWQQEKAEFIEITNTEWTTDSSKLPNQPDTEHCYILNGINTIKVPSKHIPDEDYNYVPNFYDKTLQKFVGSYQVYKDLVPFYNKKYINYPEVYNKYSNVGNNQQYEFINIFTFLSKISEPTNKTKIYSQQFLDFAKNMNYISDSNNPNIIIRRPYNTSNLDSFYSKVFGIINYHTPSNQDIYNFDIHNFDIHNKKNYLASLNLRDNYYTNHLNGLILNSNFSFLQYLPYLNTYIDVYNFDINNYSWNKISTEIAFITNISAPSIKKITKISKNLNYNQKYNVILSNTDTNIENKYKKYEKNINKNKENGYDIQDITTTSSYFNYKTLEFYYGFDYIKFLNSTINNFDPKSICFIINENYTPLECNKYNIIAPAGRILLEFPLLQHKILYPGWYNREKQLWNAVNEGVTGGKQPTDSAERHNVKRKNIIDYKSMNINELYNIDNKKLNLYNFIETSTFNITIRNLMYPQRQLIAHKDFDFNHENRNGNITEDDYIFMYNYNPSDVYTRGNRKTDILKNWKLVNEDNYGFFMDLIAYNETENISLLTKITNGDTLWNNMGKYYSYIKCIYIKTIDIINYYAILLVSNNNIRILAVRDIYDSPGKDPVTSYIISPKPNSFEEVVNWLNTSSQGKDTRNGFLWNFEIDSNSLIIPQLAWENNKFELDSNHLFTPRDLQNIDTNKYFLSKSLGLSSLIGKIYNIYSVIHKRALILSKGSKIYTKVTEIDNSDCNFLIIKVNDNSVAFWNLRKKAYLSMPSKGAKGVHSIYSNWINRPYPSSNEIFQIIHLRDGWEVGRGTLALWNPKTSGFLGFDGNKTVFNITNEDRRLDYSENTWEQWYLVPAKKYSNEPIIFSNDYYFPYNSLYKNGEKIISLAGELPLNTYNSNQILFRANNKKKEANSLYLYNGEEKILDPNNQSYKLETIPNDDFSKEYNILGDKKYQNYIIIPGAWKSKEDNSIDIPDLYNHDIFSKSLYIICQNWYVYISNNDIKESSLKSYRNLKFAYYQPYQIKYDKIIDYYQIDDYSIKKFHFEVKSAKERTVSDYSYDKFKTKNISGTLGMNQYVDNYNNREYPYNKPYYDFNLNLIENEQSSKDLNIWWKTYLNSLFDYHNILTKQNMNSIYKLCGRPQKEIIAVQAETIIFNLDKPHNIKSLKNTNKYNSWAKKYVPYNEKFLPMVKKTNTSKDGYIDFKNTSKGSYIDFDLGNVYTIIGICTKSNIRSSNNAKCRIGYGPNRPNNNEGFLMTYLINDDKHFYKTTLVEPPFKNYTVNDEYEFILNSSNLDKCLIKIKPTISRYIRILKTDDTPWQAFDYEIIIQEEKFYITNDILERKCIKNFLSTLLPNININNLDILIKNYPAELSSIVKFNKNTKKNEPISDSNTVNWILTTEEIFFKEYNIEIPRTENFGGKESKSLILNGGVNQYSICDTKGNGIDKNVSVPAGKYIDTNYNEKDHILYNCPPNYYSLDNKSAGEKCTLKSQCNDNELLLKSINKKTDNFCYPLNDFSSNLLNPNQIISKSSKNLKQSFNNNKWWSNNKPLITTQNDFKLIAKNLSEELINEIKGPPKVSLDTQRFTNQISISLLPGNYKVPNILHSNDGVSNIKDQTGINKYAQFKIEKIGINTYKITRIDPQPYPNKPSKSKETPRNFDFRLEFFLIDMTEEINYNKNYIYKQTQKCPSGYKLIKNNKLTLGLNLANLLSYFTEKPTANHRILYYSGKYYSNSFTISNSPNMISTSHDERELDIDPNFKHWFARVLYLQGLDIKNIKYKNILKLSGNFLNYLKNTSQKHKPLRINNKAKYRIRCLKDLNNSIGIQNINYTFTTIRNKKYPERQLIAQKDLWWDHKWHNDVNENDYIFMYNYNPLNVYTRNDRKTETLLNWRFEKISTGMDLIAYKGTKKVSLLTKIANGDTLWNNMGNNYTNIRHIYIETYNNIDYYAILLESDINTRILALRDMYAPQYRADPVTSYIISENYVTKEMVINFINNSPQSKDTRNSFKWSFEINGNSVTIPDYYQYSNLSNVRRLISDNNSNNKRIKTDRWRLDNIYIHNEKIVANIVADDYNIYNFNIDNINNLKDNLDLNVSPLWDFNNNIYSSQFDDEIGDNFNNIDFPYIANNIEFIKVPNTRDTYYLKNSSKNDYLYLKDTFDYGEDGKSILWHKGDDNQKTSNFLKKDNFKFKFEIVQDDNNIDLNMLYSPFNIAQIASHNIYNTDFDLKNKSYSINFHATNFYSIQVEDNKYILYKKSQKNSHINFEGLFEELFIYTEEEEINRKNAKKAVAERDKEELELLGDNEYIYGWELHNIKLNDYGNMEVVIRGLEYLIQKKDKKTVINNKYELISTGDINTYYIKKIIPFDFEMGITNDEYLYYDKNNAKLKWSIINNPNSNNYKFKFSNYIENTIYRSLKINYNEENIYQDNYYKNTLDINNNKCIKCDDNEYIDIPNHNFERCFSKTKCDNNQEYINYDPSSVINDNNCRSLPYFMFRKQKPLLENDTLEENRKGQFVNHIDSIIVSLGLIICFWNVKITCLYLKDEFDLDNLPNIIVDDPILIKLHKNIQDLWTSDLENISQNDFDNIINEYNIYKDIKSFSLSNRNLLINELKKKNSLEWQEKKFKWMLLKIFQIQKIWKTDLDNIPIQYGVTDNYEDTLGCFISSGEPINPDKFNSYISKNQNNNYTISLFNSELEDTYRKLEIGSEIALFNINSQTYLSINNNNQIKQSEKSKKGNLPKSNDSDIFWTVINGGTGIDNDSTTIKMIGLYNKKYNKLLINNKETISTKTVGKDLGANYKRINKNNHILDYEYQHIEETRFIIEHVSNNNIRLKTFFKDEELYLGIDDTKPGLYKSYKETDEKFETLCLFKVVYDKESINYKNNTEDISNETNEATKLINENNFNTFYYNIFFLESHLKNTLFKKIYALYLIYYITGCNNDSLVQFDLINSNLNNNSYKKIIKQNIRTLKVLLKIYDINDINELDGDAANNLFQKCRDDQTLDSIGYTNFNINDINLNIEGYNDINTNDKNRLNKSLTSLNNIININKYNDSKLFKNSSLEDVDKLEEFDEHNLICTKNNKRYVKCKNITEMYYLLGELIFNTNNDNNISYDFIIQNLHYAILNIKDENNTNIEKSIEKINILYKNLNKGCRNPIDKLRKKDTDNNYVYNDNGTLKEQFNNELVNDLSNELLSDIKLNTKEKCYDFILNDSEGLERCCNNKNCIPDCDDYENRINTPIEVQNTENTYAIDQKYEELYKNTNYNIDINTAIMQDKFNLTQLGCYQDLGNIKNYKKFIPTVNENNNKNNNYDLSDVSSYGTIENNINQKNLENRNYATENIINTISEREDKTKNIVENIKYKLDNAHIDYGTSINANENIDLCLPRNEISNNYMNFININDNKQYVYNIDTKKTNHIVSTEPIKLKEYYDNIESNKIDIKENKINRKDKLEYLDSIGCYNETHYREHLVDTYFDNSELNCNTNVFTNNCIINNYNEEYNKEKYRNKDNLNNNKYINAYKLCRGENYKKSNNKLNDIKNHLYYRKKYITNINIYNKKRKLTVLKILYYKMKNFNNDKIYFDKYLSDSLELSIKENMKFIVQVFRDIIILSEIKYWANLLEIFYNTNKKTYRIEINYRTKFLKLLYSTLTNKINILEFLHVCSFHLKINLTLFGDKHTKEYMKLSKEIIYDKDIWKNMRAKEMNELFSKAENIIDNNQNNTSDILTCPNGSTQQGDINADIGGCGLTRCNQRYSQNNIEECKIACNDTKDCKAFTFAPVQGDKNMLDKTVCTLYNSSKPNSTWGPNQIFCKMDNNDSNNNTLNELEENFIIEFDKKELENKKIDSFNLNT